MSEILKQAIQTIAGTHNKNIPIITFAEVVSIDTNNDTCTVITLGAEENSEIPDVKLQADTGDGILCYPAVGSTVIIAMQKDQEPFILMFSDIDKINISANKRIILNGGELGGLIKVEPLLQKINNLEQQINDLKTVFASWVVVGGDGGGALKTAVASWSGSQITKTTKTEIENNKITHGI